MTDESAKKAMAKLMPFNCKNREGGFVSRESKLLDRKYKKDILRLFDNKKVVFKCLFRASEHGYDASAFHGKCDGRGATFVVVKSGQYIFGGYNGESWSQGGNYTTGNSWIYALKNPSNNVLKLMPSYSYNQCYNGSGYGPTFGGGHDMYICSNMRSTSNYSSPSTYTTVASGYSGSFSNSTLAGSYNFTVDDLEVLAVSFK